MAADALDGTVEGVVEEQLPNALFRVRLEDGRSVRCNVSGPAKLKIVKLLEGDTVSVELSKLDPSRGRIVDAG